MRFINIDVEEKVTINELIKRAVDTFNKNLENECKQYRLSLDYNQYNIKPSKKNGMPKEDLPCKKNYNIGYNKEALISSCQVRQLSIIHSNSEVIYLKPKTKCSCVII